MKAVYINSFGPDLDISLKDVEDPPLPTADQVRVRVRAAGLNRADLLQVRGLYPPPVGYSPAIPGLEFAGEIESVGEAVSKWQPGDRVFGITAGEAQAEYLLTNQQTIARFPDDLTFAEAAAIPEAFITAHDALITQAGVTNGDTVLIHAVGSGVGLAALQIAKALGCTVIGTSRSADKIDRSGSFGLDAGFIIDDPTSFSDEIIEITNGKGVNAILDLVGGAYFQQNLVCLATGGTLMLVGLTSGSKAEFNMSVALQKRARIIGTVLRGRSTEEKALATSHFVRDVMPFLKEQTIKPNVDRIFSALDVVDAYRYLGSNESFGKVILEF